MGPQPWGSNRKGPPAGNGWSLLPHPDGCRRDPPKPPNLGLALTRRLDREIEPRVFAGLEEGVGIPADAVGYVIQERALTESPRQCGDESAALPPEFGLCWWCGSGGEGDGHGAACAVVVAVLGWGSEYYYEYPECNVDITFCKQRLTLWSLRAHGLRNLWSPRKH